MPRNKHTTHNKNNHTTHNKHTTDNKHTTHTTTTNNTTNNTTHNTVTRNRQIFEDFKFKSINEKAFNDISLDKTGKILVNVNINVDAHDDVLLTATIGWKPTLLPHPHDVENVTVEFSIYRNSFNPNHPELNLVVSTRDSAEQEENQPQTFRTTSFSFVDENVSTTHQYILVAREITGEAIVIGPVVLTATEIEGKN